MIEGRAMTSSKLQISSSSHSDDELSDILSDYSCGYKPRFKQLFGGYSGSSYLVELDDAGGVAGPTKYVLKVSNGYTYENAEFMCRTAAHLGAAGYRDCCLPIPKMKQKRPPACTDDPYVYASRRESGGVPAFLLNYVEGQQADKVMRDNPELAPTVMRGIGGGLGRMHASTAGMDKEKATSLGLRWYETDGGCCDVEDQVQNKVMDKIMADADARDHVFVPFYKKELEDLKTEMRLAKESLAIGITHGDPFADNILSMPESGQLSAFIDIEDICVGPLLFDLACCAIGCCFKASSGDEDDNNGLIGKYAQVLDFTLLSALLEGYTADRKIPALEVEHFVAYLRLTLLCNCCWRFVKFNITEKGKDLPEKAKNSYLELQRRVEYLHDGAVEAKIHELLRSLS